MSYNPRWILPKKKKLWSVIPRLFFSSEKTSIDKTCAQRNRETEKRSREATTTTPPGLFSSYFCLVIGTNNLFDKQNVRSWNFIMICWKIAV